MLGSHCNMFTFPIKNNTQRVMDAKRKELSVKVIKSELVRATKCMHDQWLPFSNLDFLDTPTPMFSFFCYKKPAVGHNLVNTLKTSLSQVLEYYYPVAGEVVRNGYGEPEIHCNNRGVRFIEAVADIKLRELDFYNPDEAIERLIPLNQPELFAVQVTQLKCGGMVISIMLDHLVGDANSASMFVLSWAEIAQGKQPSQLPSFRRSVLDSRRPPSYGSSTEELFAPFSTLSSPLKDSAKDVEDGELPANRIYYIEGEELIKLQSSVNNEESKKITKVEAFTSFLWKTVAMSIEDSGNHDDVCCVAIPVNGRKRLSEGDGAEKEKLMASQFGNLVSLAFGEKRSKELKEKSLSCVANEVHQFLKNGTTKEHFKEVIDWVEVHRPKRSLPRPLSERPVVGPEKGLTMVISSGHRFSMFHNSDFGWGKAVFTSCHIQSTRKDSFVMTIASPRNKDDWIVYIHLPLKHLNYIEAHASHLFKPLTADYLKI